MGVFDRLFHISRIQRALVNCYTVLEVAYAPFRMAARLNG